MSSGHMKEGVWENGKRVGDLYQNSNKENIIK